MASRSSLLVSVDLDEWSHCRWATGSRRSRWRTTDDFWAEVCGGAQHRPSLEPPTRELLTVFAREGVSATFFVTGEIAEQYPALVREIAGAGHEVACHGYRHVDLELLTAETFRAEVGRAKELLESLSGGPVSGFRAPNLLIEDWVLPILADLGFTYDSSVCPSRKLQGKFGRFEHLPSNPFRLRRDALEPGADGLVELPIPVVPAARLPGCSGVMTRVVGVWWTRTALRHALSRGDAVYYLHPYELTARPGGLRGLTPMQRLHSRRTGPWMMKAVERLLETFRSCPKRTCRSAAERARAAA